MSKSPKRIAAERAIYIKLGRSGSWESECLEKGIIRFGYKETPFESAQSAVCFRPLLLNAEHNRSGKCHRRCQMRHKYFPSFRKIEEVLGCHLLV